MAPCLPLPQAKPPGAVAPQEGDIRPPFFGSRGRQGLRPLQPRKVLGFGLACRLGRPLGNVPPGRSGPLKRWTKLLLVSTQLAWRDPPLRNARRRLVLSGHGPRARAFGPASLRKPRRPKAAVANCPAGSPAGLRNGNEEVGRKPSVYAGLATPPGEGVEASSPSNRLATPSCEEVRKPA